MNNIRNSRYVKSHKATCLHLNSRIIWNGYPNENVKVLAEKLQILRLLLAVAVSTKHTLRGENAFEYTELIRLLPISFYTKSVNKLQEEARFSGDSPQPERKFQKSMEDIRISKRFSAVSSAAKTIPLDIISFVGSFIRKQRQMGSFDHEDSG